MPTQTIAAPENSSTAPSGRGRTYHVPEGFLRREEACARFGVSIQVWWRWEKLGLIKCGMREGSGPKLYRTSDIERLIEEHGFLSPPYPDPARPGVYRVPLGGRNITRREAIIDAESVALLKDLPCHMGSTSEGIEFVSVSINGEAIPLRRLIMGVKNPRINVSHINGDPLDCRKENLKLKSVRQRVWGKCKVEKLNGKPTTSRFKGVFWENYTGKWRATIVAYGKKYSLGRYHDEVAAAEAYDMAAKKLFGDHAWLNFPEDAAPPPPQRLAA